MYFYLLSDLAYEFYALRRVVEMDPLLRKKISVTIDNQGRRGTQPLGTTSTNNVKAKSTN